MNSINRMTGPRFLNKRDKVTSLELERENFEKSQIASITKAINNNESPVKEKHVRRIIIGTFKDMNASLFWSTVNRLALQENPICCWKFCHVLHKLLREGHRRCIADSYKYRGLLMNLSRMWGLLKEGYGKLIQNYCTLLVNKLDFHGRNIKFPGNLMVSDEELDNIGEKDVNVFFQLSCEMFDYLDEILTLQSSVFGSLDMSRSNSMTTTGQCRLAPLICCIQDSSQLYDFSVKVLFKLHGVLPAGTLDGHRQRFLSQFKTLKQFYFNSSNLQYFKNLVQVPLLPDNPPNFLRASDLKSHVTPVVILPAQPDSPDGLDAVENLVDLSVPQSNSESSSETQSEWSYKFEQENGAGLTSAIQVKDQIIEEQMNSIRDLQREIQRINIETRTINEMQRKIGELELSLNQKTNELNSINGEKENLCKELDELKQELCRHIRGTDNQTELNKAAEKFAKMKELYNRVRTEHIDLLRSKSEVDVKFNSLKTQFDSLKQANIELETQMERVRNESNNANEYKEKFDDLVGKNKSLEELNRKLLSEMALLQQDKLRVESSFAEVELNFEKFKQNFNENQNTMNAQLIAKDWHYLDLVIKELRNETLALSGEEDINVIAANIGCTPEYFFTQTQQLKSLVESLREISSTLSASEPNFDYCIIHLLSFFHQLFNVFNCGKVIYQTLPNIEMGHDVLNKCKEMINCSLTLSEKILSRQNLTEALQALESSVAEIDGMKSVVLPEMSIKSSENLEQLLLTEIGDMDKAIQNAVHRIEQMLMNAKNKDTGVKLEVNGKILDACTALMQAIMELVMNSKQLQSEIISQGKGSADAKEFYQRNHRWTEGLISASKVVALAAKLLVDAADKVVSGKAKFEELMVASQEIAAATAQLVVASRVKADKASERMQALSRSSKRVSEATGNVVATAKSCAQQLEETEVIDFSNLTLHQAKRLEMDSQVRVIELESELTKERMRLAALRKRHYHLGGMAEG